MSTFSRWCNAGSMSNSIELLHAQAGSDRAKQGEIIFLLTEPPQLISGNLARYDAHACCNAVAWIDNDIFSWCDARGERGEAARASHQRNGL